MKINPTRILVSNDDGIHAPGIGLLESIARTFSDDVWVVAPSSEQSGAGHSLSLSKPLRIRKEGDKRYAVEGTPTDCVMIAVNHIMKDEKPTLILSGVNAGGNLAEHITYSGTVSVAMEGTLAGIPSIALSLCMPNDAPARWDTVERYAPGVIKRLLDSGFDDETLINVNFPPIAPDDVQGLHVTTQGRREVTGALVIERKDTRGHPYYWFGLGKETGIPGLETDLKAIQAGYISVTPLHLDLTQHTERMRLQAELTDEF